MPIRLLLERDEGEPYSGGWVSRVARLRTLNLEKVESDYWVSLDADVTVAPDAIRAGLLWLQNNLRWGAVGFWDGEGPVPPSAHVKACCALYRRTATRGLTYRVGDAACECLNFQRDIERRGYIVRHHNDLRCVNGSREAE